MLCYVLQCCDMLRRCALFVVPCFAMLCTVVLYCAMLCYVALCCAMLCYVVLLFCHALYVVCLFVYLFISLFITTLFVIIINTKRLA